MTETAPPAAKRGRPWKYTDAQRRAAYLKYLAGDSGREIAASIGAHPQTVSNWIKAGGWEKELVRRRQIPEHIELEISRLTTQAEKNGLTYRQTVRLSMLSKTLERLRKAAPKPKPRPIVAEAMRADLLQRTIDPEYGLLPYQRDFLLDPSRYRCVLKARQIGFTYIIGLSALLGLAAGRDQVIVSASEDQARLVLGHMRQHASRLELPFEENGREFKLATARAICLSTNWRTSQGYTGDVWFDEFAWAPQPDRLWGAIVPAITRIGGRITVCSTPFVPGNLFWRIATNEHNRWGHFNVSQITIHDAIAQGMPVPGGLDELRLNFDAATWSLFYECQWAEDGQALLSWQRLESISEDENWDLERYGRLMLGIDVGRIHDLTALVLTGHLFDPVSELFGDRIRVLKWQELKGNTFAGQRQIISDWIQRYPIEGVRIDRTGLGMQLAEELARIYPALVVGRTFTAKLKETLALGLLRLAEQGQLRLPRDPDLWARLHAVRREANEQGIRYVADRNNLGHADAFWALALACEYASPRRREIHVELW